ncbi:S8 family serine peptidase [Microbulbifer sp. YPW16]|uniref:S8 family serine peptidase n=1 Tax=Microbulbifer sp. YPW16 TaxID=2904242 RepID=UPI001E52F034|nr:S8 family serine peptidase [Microbulbifer sp. YPW16]UHQ55368.1 S8 family serine peptidase [Microbulbifer sp. YPW16]
MFPTNPRRRRWQAWLSASLAFAMLSGQPAMADDGMIDADPAPEAVQPVTSGDRLVRFVELNSKPLSEAQVNPSREAAYLRKLAVEQDEFRAQARAAGIEFTERRNFDVLFNGLSIEIDPEDLAALEALDTVSASHPIYSVMGGQSPVPAEAPEGTTRDNVTVTNLTGVPEAHSAGITGEGVVVGVIDSGIDYNHPAFGGPGFPNDKVIGGYDFADDDADPFDDRYASVEMHGTHVAGIVAGKDDIMVGVAPDAKLRVYRIFGTENPGATEDVLLAAMEQAVEDGCDVVNMSWGSNRYEVLQNGVISRATDRMLRRGTVPVVAIGNNLAGPFLPGSPAIAKSAIAVAAAYNSKATEMAFKTSNGEIMPFRAMYLGQPVPGKGTFEVVDAGTANCAALPEDVSYEGKIVLLKRGHWSCRPYMAVNLYAEAGAEAAIWWQDSWDPDRFASQFSSTIERLDIPTVAVRTGDGSELASMSPGASVSWGHFFEDPATFPGKTTFFSAWGPSHELDMKPDVMAPGGYIFSAIPGYAGYYGLMDGTSMAAPHVAGIAALMRSANPSLKAHEVRDILLSTSEPADFTVDPDLGLHPVAQQGAGMVNAIAALGARTKAEPAKLSLGEFEGRRLSRDITVENKSDTDISYRVSHRSALTVNPPMTFRWVPSTSAATVEFSSDSVVVPASGEAKLSVSFSQPVDVAEGSILSGWIELTPENGGGILRVPYLGIKGDFQALPAINPTFTDINQGLDNPSLRPGNVPNCDLPPYARPRCCSDSTPGACGWSIGKSTSVTLDFSNDSIYDDVAFTMLSQGFPMLRKYRARVIDTSGRTVAWAKDRYTGLRPAELFEHWVRNSGTGTGIDFAQWDGVLEDGSPAPEGTYYIRLEFDKLGGDGVSYPGFETWTSPPITVVR